ncbi:trypsin inhibitor like cysteine rich domain-containing protein [Ditylenchus destructor]|uniref:Trypsin inhibitor like cysteine rich domain-containing protein n=1 Tax=Ditylenchus destructor TaxID=166010 RepID=A0AAD4QTT2_9BILA|nr:trypsin inhibitor like cysteine rich domain-containing protein [Ditylenchus destructor]
MNLCLALKVVRFGGTFDGNILMFSNSLEIFVLNFVLLTAVGIAQGFYSGYDGLLLRGMLRDSKTVCPEGEIDVECGKDSEPTCDIPNESPSYFLTCMPGCVCPKGTFRQGASKCVLREQCELCPEGERLAKCSGTFQSHYHWLPSYCVSKCVCPQGSLREPKSGRCISEQDYHKLTEKPDPDHSTREFILQIVIIFSIALLVSFFVLIMVYLSILGELYLFRRPVPTVPVSENEILIP